MMRILLNPNAARARSVQRHLEARGLTYILIKDREHLAELVRDGGEIVICGGDGTINAYLQEYMRLPARTRARTITGIIPCGRANDLARELGIPARPDAALRRITLRRDATAIRRIDVIRVNDSFMITGGGLGLPSDVVADVNSLTRRYPRSTRTVKELIYLLFASWRALFGSTVVGLRDVSAPGIGQARGMRALAVAVHNQPTIGRRFTLAPGASNTDGRFDLCVIDARHPLRSLLAVMRGRTPAGTVRARISKTVIVTAARHEFMGDGEILCAGTRFRISVLRGAFAVR